MQQTKLQILGNYFGQEKKKKKKSNVKKMTNFAFKCQSIEQLQVNKIPHLFAEAGRTLKESLEDF